MRRAARIDDNQREIVRELRQIPGVTVEIIGKPVDLLVGFAAKNYLFEVKRPDKIGQASAYTKAQKEFFPRWQGQVRAISNTEQIIAVITASYQSESNECAKPPTPVENTPVLDP